MDQAGAVTLLCQSTMLGLVSYSNAAAEASPGQVCLQSVAGMLPRVHEGAPAEAEASQSASYRSKCMHLKHSLVLLMQICLGFS